MKETEHLMMLLTYSVLNQIENEGNDPLESGESYGTPHDLAGMYATKA